MMILKYVVTCLNLCQFSIFSPFYVVFFIVLPKLVIECSMSDLILGISLLNSVANVLSFSTFPV